VHRNDGTIAHFHAEGYLHLLDHVDVADQLIAFNNRTNPILWLPGAKGNSTRSVSFKSNDIRGESTYTDAQAGCA